MYVVITEGRHSDVGVEIWIDRHKAIARAREIAHSKCSHVDDYEEVDVTGWEFCAAYSCEGDCVSVRKRGIKT